jgi:nitrite reductase/ring-hydroxylating ferredoxin subunit
MNIKRLLATAAMTAGLAIGLAVNANAAPAGDDFWECAGDHQDTDGIGVCCVFYGGDYDERTGECWIDDEAKLEEANPGPSVSPKRPVLTRLPSLPVASLS